jgi:S1-C subfamily serine protease
MLLLAASSGLAADWTSVGPSVPRLEMRHGDDKGSCSGVVFLIEDGWAYALTAAHCVERLPNEKLDITANDRHAVALDSNSLLDLAIVKFRAHKEQVIVLAPSVPSIGTPVAVVGYAFGVAELVTQFGRVAQTFNKETKTAWFDVVTIFGDSGGAVVDEQGRLLAITSRIYSGGLLGQSAHISAAVPIDAVHDYLDDFSQRLKKEKK